MTELETLLRSWKARRPSPRLRARIFGQPAPELEAVLPAAGGAAALQHMPFRLGWLAPATVALLLTCVLFSHHNAFVLGQTPATGPLVAAAVSNQNAAAWLPGSVQACHNSLPVDAFEWTRGNTWASNVSSSPSRPNN